MAIIGAFRRGLQAAMKPIVRAVYGYESAAPGRRASGWRMTTANINALLAGSGDTIRAQARQAARSNPLGRNAVNTYAANIIGTGMVPQPKHPDAAERAMLKLEWDRFCNQSDADGVQNLYGQQTTVVREVYEAGECLVRKRPRRLNDGLRIPLQIQLLEPEHLPFDLNITAENGNIVRYGVEFDGLGRRVAYHLYRNHPGEILALGNNTEKTRVLASDLLHNFNPLRAGQVRGETAFAPVLAKLLELDAYDDAELVRKRLVTMLIGWIRKGSDGESVIPTTTSVNGETAPDGVGFSELEPGTVLNLPQDGTDMGWNSPSDVGGSYETFFRVQDHRLSVGLQLAYEQLTGDTLGSTYSSVRSRLIEVRRLFEQYQYNVFEFQFCRPVWVWFIEALLVAGILDARKFAANQAAYYDVDWRAQAWPWVDPVADVDAEQSQVRNGFKARATVVYERGGDVESVDTQQAADNKRADGLGLQYDSDGRVAAAGSPGKASQPAAASSAKQGKQSQVPQ